MGNNEYAVAIMMGSSSDLEVMMEAAKVLDSFGVSYDVEVTSAHRSPARTRDYVKRAEEGGVRVFIVGAGAAAHLAGVVAAESTLPVIGVPLSGSALNGLDALYSTVMMPGGIPVATMAIGKAGATNAGVFAVEILATSDSRLAGKLKEYKANLASKVEEASREAKKRAFPNRQ
ncbi:MAG TPA: 5-(carboxyamino)imidazole ribonucleotide mutase [Blastocatellia bacterium]|nr:5-(carboxyamino)imidazole ribonucleotide mutase [Blastocatellia bacterium]